MRKGKEKCEKLKSIRREIAEKYDLQYNPRECTYEGDCRGTCPACDAELRDLQRQLELMGFENDIDVSVDVDVDEFKKRMGELTIHYTQGKLAPFANEDFAMHTGQIIDVMEGVVPAYRWEKRFLMECYVAGVNFHDVDWDELYEGAEVVLVRHKSNKYDKNAIAVVLACDYCGEDEEDFDFDYILGYIPREENEFLAMDLDLGMKFECRISQVKRYGPYKERLRIAIYFKNETEKVDNSHLLRVAELDNKEFTELTSDLSSRGFACFRFGGYPIEEFNLPEEGDKVVFFHKRENDVVLYMMYTMAVGDESASRFLTEVEAWCDDCTYFIFTNIKGPLVVAHKDIDFLKSEESRFGFRQPNQFISESGSKKLWDMFDKM